MTLTAKSMAVYCPNSILLQTSANCLYSFRLFLSTCKDTENWDTVTVWSLGYEEENVIAMLLAFR